MRKLNIAKTSNNVNTMAANNTLYSFYGLTENSDYDKHKCNYVKEHFRFSCGGNNSTRQTVVKEFINMFTVMQEAYKKAMNIKADLFKITRIASKIAPYDTIVIDIDVENIKGAFATIINCAGPDLHQFHASDVWVRANENADVWKSLFDRKEDATSETNTPFTWVNINETNAWLSKVKDARAVVCECIKTAGEPTDEEKERLKQIMCA